MTQIRLHFHTHTAAGDFAANNGGDYSDNNDNDEDFAEDNVRIVSVEPRHDRGRRSSSLPRGMGLRSTSSFSTASVTTAGGSGSGAGGNSATGDDGLLSGSGGDGWASGSRGDSLGSGDDENIAGPVGSALPFDAPISGARKSDMSLAMVMKLIS